MFGDDETGRLGGGDWDTIVVWINSSLRVVEIDVGGISLPATDEKDLLDVGVCTVMSK